MGVSYLVKNHKIRQRPFFQIKYAQKMTENIYKKENLAYLLEFYL